MMTIEADYERFQSEGETMAGELGDFRQRARAYHRLYRHSKGNFAFPLLAAHGALWGAGHMRRGLFVSRVLLMLSPRRGGATARLAMVEDFTNALKEINRQVLIKTYVAYQMTRYHADDPRLAEYVAPELSAPLAACHEARRLGQRLPDEDRRNLFEAAFLFEQDFVVGPSIDAALPQFNWPLVRALAMRPPIGFRYFGPLERLWFADFSDKDERIKRGLQAYDIAERQGWDFTEGALANYPCEKGQRPKFLNAFCRAVCQ